MNSIKNEALASFERHFGSIQEIRKRKGRLHPLKNILFITILGVICGADEFTEIEEFGKSKIKLLSKILDLKNGIPSHDTFGRVLALLNPDVFRTSFINWVEELRTVSKDIVNIDGKALRRSFDTESGKSMIYMVSAWADANNLVLGQVKVSDKSNEITAIPKLLALLNLEGCIVTIDAMGTQKAIAQEIRNQKADYLLALKGNQGILQEEVKESFERFNAKENTVSDRTVDGGHGRVEERTCYVALAKDFISPKVIKDWKDLQSIVKVETCTYYKNGKQVGKQVYEERYYISSLKPDAVKLNNVVRKHWGIETKVHWVLDIAFREDDCRVRQGHADENLAIIRHIALNKLKNESSCKRGIKGKRKKAGWDDQYLLKILSS